MSATPTTTSLTAPTSAEYGAFYSDYVRRVPESDAVEALASQMSETLAILHKFTDESATRLKGTTLWSVKEVLGHLCDSDRILAYRALRISRGDKTPLPGYEQDDYVPAGRFNQRSLASLIEEYTYLRKATLALAKSLTPEMMLCTGTANDSTLSVRAILRILVGHERRHLELIEKHSKA